MIDYSKLKLAHELAEKYAENIERPVGICNSYWPSSGDRAYQIMIFAEPESGYLTIDDLITKLRELAQPKPKYTEGDTVWTYTGAQINEWMVHTIYWEKDANDYRLNLYQNLVNGSFLQADCYPSKAQLIAAQIKYWESLKEELEEEEPQITPGIPCETEPFILYPAFEGPVAAFKGCQHDYKPSNYGQSNREYQCTKCKAWKDECQHEPELNFANDPRPRAEKGNPKCRYCGKIYEPKEFDHKSNGMSYMTNPPQNKCLKCGEFYR